MRESLEAIVQVATYIIIVGMVFFAGKFLLGYMG